MRKYFGVICFLSLLIGCEKQPSSIEYVPESVPLAKESCFQVSERHYLCIMSAQNNELKGDICWARTRFNGSNDSTSEFSIDCTQYRTMHKIVTGK